MMQLPASSKRGEDDRVPSDGKHRRSETTIRATVQPSPTISSFSFPSSRGKEVEKVPSKQCVRVVYGPTVGACSPTGVERYLIVDS